MPLYRSGLAVGGVLEVAGAANLRGNTSILGANNQIGTSSSDNLTEVATVLQQGAPGPTCVYKKRILNLGDEDYTLDVADIQDKIYMNPTSITLRHLILTYGAGFAGHEFWIVNVGNHDLSIDDLVGPTHFGTLAPQDSAIYEADATGASWRLVMRGVTTFSI